MLRKLGLPEVAKERMLTVTMYTVTQLFTNHLALPQCQENVISVIKFMLEKDEIVWTLSLSESKTLLEYFQEGCSTLSVESMQTLTIKTFPVFILQGYKKTTDLHQSKH